MRPVPVVEKRLMDVKLGELGTWLGGRDFTPNGILTSIRRGEFESSGGSGPALLDLRVCFQSSTLMKKIALTSLPLDMYFHLLMLNECR